jgi:hypothetical protein
MEKVLLILSLTIGCLYGQSAITDFEAPMSFSPSYSENDYPTGSPSMNSYDGGCFISDYSFFYNLQNNFPINTNGDCTWIALEMYLCYLEATQNPNIIESKYLISSTYSTDSTAYFESPGIWNQSDSKPFPSLQDFDKDFVDHYSGDRFHYPSLVYCPTGLFNASEQKDLLISYLEDKGFVENTDFYVPFVCSVLNMNYTYDFIIDELQACRPVIVNTPQHSFIAYGYIPNTMKLIVHNGWHSYHSHDIFDVSEHLSPSTGIQYAISVGFYQHEHSYLYLNDTNAYCSCGDCVYRYPYFHKHKMTIELNHGHAKAVCSICGYTEKL